MRICFGFSRFHHTLAVFVSYTPCYSSLVFFQWPNRQLWSGLWHRQFRYPRKCLCGYSRLLINS